MNINAVAVFCGSKHGENPIYAQHAAELGKLLAVLNLKLIYGGGKRGLMGVIADSVLENGGQACGVIPKVLIDWEQQHDGLSELTIVPDMHTRKKMMYDLCDVAIVMPGGFGTMDEFFEMLTWNQLKIHDKKIYILNSDGYYQFMQQQMQLMQKEGFLYESPEERIIFCNSPVEIFNRIE